MPLIRENQSPVTPLEAVMRRLAKLEKEVKNLRQAGAMTVHRHDVYRHPSPVQGETVLHAPMLTDDEIADEDDGYQRRKVDLKHYHDQRWRSFGNLVIPLSFPDETAEVKNPIIYFPAPEDLDTAKLQRVEAGLRVAGSGVTNIDVLINGTSMLIDTCKIDGGDTHSKDSVNPVGINGNNNEIAHGDPITIRTITVGAGSKGLTLILGFA